jgi:HEPN domain-containing protein
MLHGSPHRREVEILRGRAYDFLEGAREALMRGRCDLSCFLSEQAAQLYLKSTLLELVGDYPRVHHIRALLSEVLREKPSKELEAFIRDNRARLSSLEDAYAMARYTTKMYAREDAEDMIKLAEEVISVVKKVLSLPSEAQ